MPSIAIDCRPSAAAWLIAAASVTAAAGVPWTVLPPAWAAPVAALALGFILYGLHGSRWLGRRALRAAFWSGDGQWWLVDGEGRRFTARLAAGCRIYGAWLWLSWQGPAGRVCVIVSRAGSGADSARRLAARLRLAGAQQDSPAAHARL